MNILDCILCQLRSEISLHFCQNAFSPTQIVQMGYNFLTLRHIIVGRCYQKFVLCSNFIKVIPEVPVHILPLLSLIVPHHQEK